MDESKVSSQANAKRRSSRLQARGRKKAVKPRTLQSLGPPEFRLFLSVDLVGSTGLKSKLDYLRVLEWREKVEDLIAAVDTVRSQPHSPPPLTDERVEEYLRERGWSDVPDDWKEVQQRWFDDFDANFRKNLREWDEQAGLWKSLGDEYVYSYCLKSPYHLVEALRAFATTIHEFDRAHKEKSRHGLRARGTAWTAGFPIRNREVQLPVGGQPGSTKAVDYWGPEIDIGFRLTKEGHPGLVTCALDIISILETQRSRDFSAAIVDWKPLDGVWKRNRHLPYPIIWLKVAQEVSADELHPDPWLIVQSERWQRWLGQLPSDGVARAAEAIRRLRELHGSSDQLDLIDPYFPSSISDHHGCGPEQHQKIRSTFEILERVSRPSKDPPSVPKSGSKKGRDSTEDALDRRKV